MIVEVGVFEIECVRYGGVQNLGTCVRIEEHVDRHVPTGSGLSLEPFLKIHATLTTVLTVRRLWGIELGMQGGSFAAVGCTAHHGQLICTVASYSKSQPHRNTETHFMLSALRVYIL